MGQDDRKRQKKIEAKRKKRAQELGERKVAVAQKSTPEALTRRAAGWPVRECRINANWRAPGALATLLVVRENPRGGLAVGSFLVDLGCLGVKSAWVNHDMTSSDVESLAERFGGGEPLAFCAPELAARIVQVGLDYAASLGFAPDPDFRVAGLLLEGLDPSACTEEVRGGGPDGNPFFIAGPNDNADRILTQLARRRAAIPAVATPAIEAKE